MTSPGRDPTETLLADLDAFGAGRCPACRREVGGHAFVVNVALGYKDRPRCIACLAAELGHEPAGFARHVHDYVRRRECYREGWARASRRLGLAADARPEEVWGVTHDAEWDAGDMGCGDLVLQLRMRLTRMGPGETLLLTAADPGAPADLPAWCGLTGHTLLRADHPRYWIRRRTDKPMEEN